jgi:hypothetical protein
MKGMMTYYQHLLKEESTGMHFPRFENREGIQMLGGSLPGELSRVVGITHSPAYEIGQQSPTPYQILESSPDQ